MQLFLLYAPCVCLAQTLKSDSLFYFCQFSVVAFELLISYAHYAAQWVNSHFTWTTTTTKPNQTKPKRTWYALYFSRLTLRRLFNYVRVLFFFASLNVLFTFFTCNFFPFFSVYCTYTHTINLIYDAFFELLYAILLCIVNEKICGKERQPPLKSEKIVHVLWHKIHNNEVLWRKNDAELLRFTQLLSLIWRENKRTWCNTINVVRLIKQWLELRSVFCGY